MASATKTAQSAKPIQRWISVMYSSGAIVISELLDIGFGCGGLPSMPPTKRNMSQLLKCEVPKAIFSAKATPSGGSVAHSSGARRAHAEAIRNQPQNGAHHNPWNAT